MAVGYFNDGTVDIELGEHVFASPSARRRIVTLDPHSAPAAVLDSGGGILELEVTAQRVRTNLGDAERYIYEQLLALSDSGPGNLAYEDNRGHRHVFGDAVCVGGSGVVEACEFADMRLDFACPEKSAEPAWVGAPAAPGVYAGTDTLQDYAAGGVTLGVGGRMRIEMSRDYPLREIPRARGARATVPQARAVIRFIIDAARVAGTESLATDLEDLARSISGLVNLTANGNTFTDVLLERMRPSHTDRKFTMVQFSFVKDLSAGGAGAWSGTTTTAAPTTTTTTTP